MAQPTATPASVLDPAAQPREGSAYRKRGRPSISELEDEDLQGLAVDQAAGQQMDETEPTSEMQRRWYQRMSPVITDLRVQHRRDAASLEQAAQQHAADLEVAKTTAHDAQLQLRAEHTEQLAALQRQHHMALQRLEQTNAELNSALKACKGDSKQFRYAVRGSSEASLQGSVPATIFSAEPDSMLARMYGGPWEYDRDDQGQAIVNSDPAHWLLILNWLSFGAVPSEPSPAFQAECRYWQLQNLLDVLNTPAHSPSKDPLEDCISINKSNKYNFTLRFDSKDCKGRMTAEGYVYDFRDRVEGNRDNTQEISIGFPAFSHTWWVTMATSIVHIYPSDVDTDRDLFSAVLTVGKHEPLQIFSAEKATAEDLANGDAGMDYILQKKVYSPPYVDARGRGFMTFIVEYH